MGIYNKFRKSTDKKCNDFIHQNLDGLDLNGSDEEKKLKEISKIKDNDFLLNLALNDPLIQVRIRAVELIDDGAVLKDIACNNPNSRLRVAAIGNRALTKEKLFRDLAEDSNKDVRIAAIKRIDDENILSDIANSESNKEVRKIALEKIRK